MTLPGPSQAERFLLPARAAQAAGGGELAGEVVGEPRPDDAAELPVGVGFSEVHQTASRARARRAALSTLPLEVSGSSGTTNTRRGTL